MPVHETSRSKCPSDHRSCETLGPRKTSHLSADFRSAAASATSDADCYVHRMFDIDVVSDPVSNFSVDGWISNDAYSRLTAFDESLVKPALVLADRVNLYTVRVDFDRTTAAAAFENKNMPMRFLHAFASVCRAGDLELLETLGLDQKFLPTADELSLFSSSTPRDKQWWKAVGKFEKKYSGPIVDYRTSFHRILRQRHEDLEAPHLQPRLPPVS